MGGKAPVPDVATASVPTIAAQGGGGSGGSGSGKKGKKGKSKKKGKGKKGKDKTKGGKKGAKACGKGKAASCSNCGHRVGRGDPVDAVTGEVFTVPKTDLLLPGLFDLAIVRKYSSESRGVDVGMGFGWTHSLAWKLEERRGDVVIDAGDGRHVEMPLPVQGDASQSGGWVLVRGKGVFALRPGNEFVHLFAPVEPGSKTYRLERVRWRGRGEIRLEYERGLLASVVDSVGRTILVDSTPEGRIRSLSVPGERNENVVFARYTYDATGNLVSAVDAEGHTTRYWYDEDHRLVCLQYPSGLAFYFKYDSAGRCFETWGQYPGGPDPALAENLPKYLADNRTRAKGILHCRIDFGDEYTEVVDSVGTQRFFAGPDGAIAKAVGTTGGITSRVFDDDGNVAAETDPTGGTWKYEYDALGNVSRETDPENHGTIIERDFEGRETKVVNPLGGVTTIDRDASGEIVAVRDPNGALSQSFRDGRGLMTSAIDGRGGHHAFEFDDHANCVARTFPNGATFRFEYDFWGNLVRQRDPLGRETIYRQTPSGKLLSITDPLGRTTAYEYDAMGNPIVEISPDGSVARKEYGGFNWLVATKLPDGSQIRRAYNREGWELYYENERGERHECEYRADGQLVSQKTAYGQVLRYQYDALGRLLGWDDGTGKVQVKLSPVGRVLEEEARDGSIRKYEYDAAGGLVKADSGGAGFEWTRDAAGNILSERLFVDGASYAVESRLNVVGDRLAFRTSLGFAMDVKRDQNGNVAELWTDEGRALTITRDEFANPVRTDFQRGGAVVESYNAVGLVERRQVLGPGASSPSPDEPGWVGSGAWGGQVFEYTAVDEVRSVSSSDGTSIEFEYDVRRHLVKAHSKTEPEEFRIDPAENYYEVGPGAETRVYERGNQLVRRGEFSYRYDDRGFMIEKTRKAPEGDEVTRFTWGAWGLLEAVDSPDGTRLEFVYDAFARRLAKKTLRDGEVISQHHYVWDLVSMVHDVRVSPEKAPEEVRTYLFEENSRVAPIGERGDGQWLHYLLRGNGLPEEIVDSSGKRVGRLGHTAFGRVHAAEGASTPFRFSGQFEDEETGLHYNRYRYYDPDAGRYISPDPIGIDGGLNVYAYGPNPVGWMDPMGWAPKHTVLVEGPQDFKDYANSEGHSDKGSSGEKYTSGSGAKPGTEKPANPNIKCPPELNSQPRCHTEQKFSHDLIKGVNSKAVPRGGEYKLTGQYPPCQICHTSMMRAAKETGSKIDYEWNHPKGAKNPDGSPRMEKVTYDGKSGPKGSVAVSGTNTKDPNNPNNMTAQDLVNKYGSKDQGNWDQSKEKQGWGYKNEKGAKQNYEKMAGEGGFSDPPAPKKRKADDGGGGAPSKKKK